RLEEFFREIRITLTSRGAFAMREYVGPNRLQWTDEQLALGEAVLRLLPKEYRRMPNGKVKHREGSPRLRDVIRSDPSEAVRSSEILRALRANLKVIHYTDTGGTLLNIVLNEIAGNFERDERGRALLASLIRLDRELFEGGLLPSDYMFCIAQRSS